MRYEMVVEKESPLFVRQTAEKEIKLGIPKRSFSGKERFTHPQDVFVWWQNRWPDMEPSESMRVLFLDARHRLIGWQTIATGSVNAAAVSMREIFTGAIGLCSAGIIVAHNHPSGNPVPSTDDFSVAERIKKSSKLLGIDCLDFIIIGNEKYVSLKEQGKF